MKTFYLWIAMCAALLFAALFFKHLPATQGMILTGALLLLNVGFLVRLARK